MSNHNDADFFAKWPEDFEDNVWQDDDQSTDVMALVVLGDVPVEVCHTDPVVTSSHHVTHS
jgi:hypothetical protein